MRRTLGLLEASYVGIAATIGSAIFVLLGDVYSLSGSLLPLSFLAGWIAVTLIGYCHSRLAVRYPHSAGFYVYVREVLGRSLGILVASSFILSISSWVSLTASGMYRYILEIGDVGRWVVPASIVSLGLLNAAGSKFSARFQILASSLSIALLLSISIPILGSSKTEFHCPTISGFLSSLPLVFLMYLGYSAVLSLAGEVENPSKNLPRAIFLSTTIPLIVYLLLSLAMIENMDPGELSGIYSPIARIASLAFGEKGRVVSSIIGISICLAIINTGFIHISNYLSSLSIDLGARWMTKRLAAIISILLIVFSSSIDAIITAANLTTLVFIFTYSLTLLAFYKVEESRKRYLAIPALLLLLPFTLEIPRILVITYSIFALLVVLVDKSIYGREALGRSG